MRVLERVPGYTGWRPVHPSAQTFCDAQELFASMLKHVGTDDTVHGLCVEFENTRVALRHEKELQIVAQLSTAYYNSLTAEVLKHLGLRKHEKDLVCVFITAGPFTKLCAWGRRRVEDMCYEIRRAEACVD